MGIVAITGAGGYIGRKLVEQLSVMESCSRILATDIREPLVSCGKLVFSKRDIRDRGLYEFFSGDRIDCLIHLAFIVDPLHDEDEMYDINVNGTLNILDICEKLGVKQVIVASSASAYGAYADNREFLREEDPIRVFPKSFSYAHHKGINEGYFKDFAARNPGVIFNVIRPCIVYGPNVNNYLSRFWKKLPVVMLLNGNDTPWQFVHEEDVASLIIRLVEAKLPGAFNVAPPDTVKYSEIAGMIGKPVVKVPLGPAKVLAGLIWRLRYLEMPPGALDYTAFPWTVDSSKARSELGFEFRHSSRETIEIMLKAHGLWPGKR
jgi:UDP-glucose 4-epimerase